VIHNQQEGTADDFGFSLQPVGRTLKIDGTLKGLDQRGFDELIPTKVEIFGCDESGWGVRVSRSGELPQTILPQREIVISWGSIPCLESAPLRTIRTFTLNQASRVVIWLKCAGMSLDRNASVLRMEAVEIALKA
jgi:hypothetical protein